MQLYYCLSGYQPLGTLDLVTENITAKAYVFGSYVEVQGQDRGTALPVTQSVVGTITYSNYQVDYPLLVILSIRLPISLLKLS